MYTIDNLRDIVESVDLKNLNLKLYAEFFHKHLSNRVYFIELENGEVLNFTINNEHLPHLIALHKFYDPSNTNLKLHKRNELKKEKGFLNIYNEDITIEHLLSVYKGTGKKREKVFRNYKNRILGFPFSYQMLRKSGFFIYKKEDALKPTKIKGDYLFSINNGNIKYHFIFINNSNVIEDNYVPITFITTKFNDFTYFNPQKRIGVKKILIKNLLDDVSEEIIFQNIDFKSNIDEVAVELDINNIT